MRLSKSFLASTLLASICFAQQPNATHPIRKPAAESTAAKVTVPQTPGLDPSSLDKTVDPCVDFYAYACGGWQKKNPIPPDQSSISLTSNLQDDNRELLRRILEDASAPDSPRGPINQKIGDYYASCMQPAGNDVVSGTPASMGVVREVLSFKEKSDLPSVLAALHPTDIYIYFGQSAFFRFGSTQDSKNSAEVIAEVDQGGLGLPDRDYYFKDDARSKAIREKYVAHVQKMFELFPADSVGSNSPERAAADAAAVMRIETALAKGHLSRVERRDPNKLYHRISVQELQALSPSFDWSKYFAAFGLKVQTLNVAVPEFIKTFGSVLSTEPANALNAYLRWHLIHAQARFMIDPIVEEDFNFYGKTLTGQQQIQPRWKRCVRFTDRALGDALGQAYVDIAFSADGKARALKMVQAIEKAMERDIQQLTWMSRPTKEQALAKLHGVVNKIGYPDKWRDYTALKIVRGDTLGNGMRANDFEFRRQLTKIGKPVDKSEWFITPPTVNAYYNAQNNDINFPAGILQPPLFDPKMDDAPNYGDTGGTIGHELTHGFDDEGRQFDFKGNLRDWWQPADAKEFELRAQCIVDQYAQYTVTGDVKINSKLTLGEDVADLGGLILAYMAWRDETKGQRLKPIDGLTPDQRFFVGYAQSWCSNERPEVLRMRAATDAHSPAKWRTNGVVSNMPEFQQAFQCKAGQAMAPEKRCRVW